MPLTNGSGSGSCYFRHWPSRCQQKTNLKKKLFCLFFFWRYIYIIFQRQKVKKKSHRRRNQGFSFLFLLGPEPDPNPYLWLMDPEPDPGGPKTYGAYGSGSTTLTARALFSSLIYVTYAGSVGTVLINHSNGSDTIQFDQKIRIQRWNSWSSFKRTLSLVLLAINSLICRRFVLPKKIRQVILYLVVAFWSWSEWEWHTPNQSQSGKL
jgi:hypothetical protein